MQQRTQRSPGRSSLLASPSVKKHTPGSRAADYDPSALGPTPLSCKPVALNVIPSIPKPSTLTLKTPHPALQVLQPPPVFRTDSLGEVA